VFVVSVIAEVRTRQATPSGSLDKYPFHHKTMARQDKAIDTDNPVMARNCIRNQCGRDRQAPVAKRGCRGPSSRPASPCARAYPLTFLGSLPIIKNDWLTGPLLPSASPADVSGRVGQLLSVRRSCRCRGQTIKPCPRPTASPPTA